MRHALMSPAFPDVVREWAGERASRTMKPAGFAARVAALVANLQTDRLLDVIRVF
jgi:hypothetical protein